MAALKERMAMATEPQSIDSDAALLALFAQGDQAAARALTARVLPGVFALARRMLKDNSEAEDVAQDAMIKLWKIAPDWRSGEAKVTTWLYRIVANLCTDRLRKRRTIGLDQAPEQADDSPSVEASLIANDRASALRIAMDQLPERQKLALNLRHFQELSNPEIAQILETSVEAVESLLGRARRSLKEILAPKRAELGLAQNG